MNEDIPSIPDLLKMRAWRQALFTTYTLSLSYFESEVLRPLLRAGCTDIWLVSDAEGYRSSLLERRSMRVGQEYRLVPVALPHGVFHAKCIYLGSDDGDLLLVGSGNVTFGGHGRNAEVFEVLEPDSEAYAFGDFASFLEAVGSRADIAIAATDWVDVFAGRARQAARHGRIGAGGPPLRLVHPLKQPIIDQLPGILAPYGACSRLTVMSPYHDPDGSAVRRLAEALGADDIAVAVTDDGVSPFPFHETQSWDANVISVKPGLPDRRFVHAKWYEFDMDERRVLLTGSINATRKSLTTTDNVELGVVRVMPEDGETLAWAEVELPRFEAQKRQPAGLQQSEVVYASFDKREAGKLGGRLISLRPVAGAWEGRLIQADGDTMSFSITVNEDGSFSLVSPDFEVFAEMPALQILLTKGDREARGWVHNEMFLSVQGRRRLTAGALSRLMRREGSDDDIEALLDYLSVTAEHHLRIFDRPVQKAEEQHGDGQDTARSITVNIADIAPVAGEATAPQSHAGGGPRDDQLDAALTRLRRMMLGHGRARYMPLQAQASASVAEEDLAGDRQIGPGSDDAVGKLGLSEFEHAMAQLIQEAGNEPEVMRGLLAMQLEVCMWFRLDRLDDSDAAHEFLRGWYSRACRLASAGPLPPSALQQHVITAAAVLFLLATRSGRQTSKAAELHDNLERYYRGPVDLDKAVASLMPEPHAGFASALLGDVTPKDIESALVDVLSKPTIRQQLADALDYAANGKSVPQDWDVFQSRLGNELLQAFGNPNWQRKIRPASSARKACVFDNFAFAYDEAVKFEYLRIGRCIHCSRFTLNVKP